MSISSTSAQLQKRYIDGPDGQVHIAEIGTGVPLVLHHQSPTDSSQFKRAAPLLAERGIHAILVDTPGYGGSSAPKAPPSIETYAKTTSVVFGALGLDSAFLLGHHTGAMVATEAALSLKDRVQGIILNGPITLTLEEREGWLANTMAFEKSWALRPDGSHFKKYWDYVLAVTGEVHDVEAFNWLVSAALGAGDKSWYGHNACFKYDHRASLMRLSGLGTPTLILTNTGSALYPVAQTAHEQFPEFDYKCLEGGTIDFANEYPEIWAQAVVAFINKVRS